jgi:hypothetical protein
MPSKTIKSDTLTSRNISAIIKRAETSGLFLRGPVSWNMPIFFISLGRKNLDIVSNVFFLERVIGEVEWYI